MKFLLPCRLLATLALSLLGMAVAGCSVLGLFAGTVLDDHEGTVKRAQLVRLVPGRHLTLCDRAGRLIRGSFEGIDSSGTAPRVRMNVEGAEQSIALDSLDWAEMPTHRNKVILSLVGAGFDTMFVIYVLLNARVYPD